MAGINDNVDALSTIRVVKQDDKKVVSAARWMPRVELGCGDKRCLLLGGHRAETNAIMVWCTCGQPDSAHPEGSRLMALDSWLVEHARGEDLEAYEAEEEDEEGEDPVDALCMREARVLSLGGRPLDKQISLRQLLTRALVKQGGTKDLKGVIFWVYWYDQPIPQPGSAEYKGRGKTWVAGPLADPGVGLWYKAKITGCDGNTGALKIRYDVDGSEDACYLLVAFAHFGGAAPSPGAQPQVLPEMEQLEETGFPPAAAHVPSAAGASGAAGAAGASAGAKAKGARPKSAASVPAAKRTPVAASAAPVPVAAAVAAVVEPTATPAAAPTAQPAAAPPKAAAAAPAAPLAPDAGAKPAKAPKEPKAAADKETKPAKEPKSAKPPKAAKSDKPLKRPSSPRPTARAEAQPVAAAAAAAPAAPATAATAAAAPLQRVLSGQRLCGPLSGAGAGAAPPAKRLRHEFESLTLSSSDPNAGRGAPPPQGPAPGAHLLTDEARQRLEAQALSRPGFRGLISGQQEQVPVFAFNTVDVAPPPAFEYVGPEAYAAALPAQLAAAGAAQPAVAAAAAELRALCEAAEPRWGGPCGRSYHAAVRRREEEEQAGIRSGGAAPVQSREGSYGPGGQLIDTRPLGVHECSPSCSDPRCLANMQLSRGVTRPLEVFRTPDRRWGLRCAQPLAPGDWVAPLLGRLAAAATLAEVADGAAAATNGGAAAGAAGALPEPPGVVLLNHFFGLWEAVYTRGINWCDRHVRLWQLPPNPLACALRSSSCTHATEGGNGNGNGAASGTSAPADPARPAARRLACMLAIDTRSAGNVARFVRQWSPPPSGAGPVTPQGLAAGPALVVQPVLAGACRSPQLYYLGLFAARHVAAGEELTCDWSNMSMAGEGPGGAAGPAR